MAFNFDDITVGKRLFVGSGKPEILGRGPLEIRGSSYIEGPSMFGNPSVFPNIWATVMIGPMRNRDSPPAVIPGRMSACGGVNNSPYSLAVKGNAAIFNNLDISQKVTAGSNIFAGGSIRAQGEVSSFCGAHRLSNKKNFDIPHPSKEGWRLRHTCPEAPTNDVYIRGRVKNKTTIDLPEYWKNFVDIKNITVTLTPIGSHQDIIIKGWDNEQVTLQSNGGLPIDCFYTIYAERIDGDRLVPEYRGLTPNDYPGDNNEYNVNI
jgi:hypothetical protein